MTSGVTYFGMVVGSKPPSLAPGTYSAFTAVSVDTISIEVVNITLLTSFFCARKCALGTAKPNFIISLILIDPYVLFRMSKYLSLFLHILVIIFINVRSNILLHHRPYDLNIFCNIFLLCKIGIIAPNNQYMKSCIFCIELTWINNKI